MSESGIKGGADSDGRDRQKVGRAVPSAPGTFQSLGISRSRSAGGGALGTARPTWPALVFALALSVLFGAGCASEKAGAPPLLATVEVRDRTPREIANVAIEVFRDHGYEVSKHTKREVTFDKPGSGFSRFAYGDWTTPNSVWERVTVTIIPELDTQTRLECDARLITNKGEALEETVKYGHVKRKPLQQIMDEIATRLREPPPEPPAVEEQKL